MSAIFIVVILGIIGVGAALFFIYTRKCKTDSDCDSGKTCNITTGKCEDKLLTPSSGGTSTTSTASTTSTTSTTTPSSGGTSTTSTSTPISKKTKGSPCTADSECSSGRCGYPTLTGFFKSFFTVGGSVSKVCLDPIVPPLTHTWKCWNNLHTNESGQSVTTPTSVINGKVYCIKDANGCIWKPSVTECNAIINNSTTNTPTAECPADVTSNPNSWCGKALAYTTNGETNTTSNTNTNTTPSRLPVDSPCTTSSECETMLCASGKCTSKRASGSTCAFSEQCASGVCDLRFAMCV